MVKNILTFGQTGLSDWIWQRISAVVIAAYLFFLVGYCAMHAPVGFGMWHQLFASTGMRIFTLITLLCLAIHAWIGVWTVITDYIKPLALRFIFELATILVLGVSVIWGVQILWSL